MSQKFIQVDVKNKDSLKQALLDFKEHLNKLYKSDKEELADDIVGFLSTDNTLLKDDFIDKELVEKLVQYVYMPLKFEQNNLEELYDTKDYMRFSQVLVFEHAISFPEFKDLVYEILKGMVDFSVNSSTYAFTLDYDGTYFGDMIITLFCGKYPEYTYMLGDFIPEQSEFDNIRPTCVGCVAYLYDKYGLDENMLNLFASCRCFELRLSMKECGFNYPKISQYLYKNDKYEEYKNHFIEYFRRYPQLIDYPNSYDDTRVGYFVKDALKIHDDVSFKKPIKQEIAELEELIYNQIKDLPANQIYPRSFYAQYTSQTLDEVLTKERKEKELKDKESKDSYTKKRAKIKPFAWIKDRLEDKCKEIAKELLAHKKKDKENYKKEKKLYQELLYNYIKGDVSFEELEKVILSKCTDFHWVYFYADIVGTARDKTLFDRVIQIAKYVDTYKTMKGIQYRRPEEVYTKEELRTFDEYALELFKKDTTVISLNDYDNKQDQIDAFKEMIELTKDIKSLKRNPSLSFGFCDENLDTTDVSFFIRHCISISTKPLYIKLLENFAQYFANNKDDEIVHMIDRDDNEIFTSTLYNLASEYIDDEVLSVMLKCFKSYKSSEWEGLLDEWVLCKYDYEEDEYPKIVHELVEYVENIEEY